MRKQAIKQTCPLAGHQWALGSACGLLEPGMRLLENGPDAGTSHSQDGTCGL